MTTTNDPPVPEPPPWSFWRRPELPKDRCHMVMHLRNRKDKRKLMVKMLFCLVWRCARCGPILKRMWLHHLSKVTDGIDKIYLCTRTRDTWGALHKMIHRLDGQYCRVEIEDGSLVIFTTAAVGELVPFALRADFLRAVIDATCFRPRPITTSRGWGGLDRKSKRPEWTRVAWLHISLKEAREVFRQLGLKWPKRDRNGGDYVVVELPDSWMEDDERGFKNLCRHLERGPTVTESDPGEERGESPGSTQA